MHKNVENLDAGENIVKIEDISELDMAGSSATENTSIVETDLNLCVCCLSGNVPFVRLSNCEHVEFFECNFKFKFEYPETLVCYVCHGMLKNIYEFKKQVEINVNKLNNRVRYLPPNNTIFHKLQQSNIELFHTQNSEPIEQEIIKPKLNFEIKTEVKIEYDISDPDNDVPLSEIKEKKVKIKKKPNPQNKYDGKIKTILLNETEMWEDRKNEAAKDRYLKLLYKCEHCIIGYDHELTLKEHMEKRHGSNIEGFTCAICKSVLTSQGSFREHMRRHYRRIECVACGARYSTVVSALTHYSKMHAAIHTKYKCTECEFTTPSYRRFRYHRDSHKQKVSCAVCGNSFVNNSGLKVHMYTVHKVSDRVYSCAECSKTYRARSGLLAHASSAHGAPGAFCVPCGTHFRTELNLRHHLNTHSKHTSVMDKKFVCNLCDARYISKAQLRQHIDWDHLKNTKNKCNKCDKPFKSISALKRHIGYVHEKKRPPRNKMCDHCGRGFTTMSILRAHIRTHTGERPHACARCPATFAHSAALYTHNKLLHNKQ